MFNITDKIVVVYDLLLFVLLLNQFKFKSTYLKKKKNCVICVGVTISVAMWIVSSSIHCYVMLCSLQRNQWRENHPHQQPDQEPAQLLCGTPG